MLQYYIVSIFREFYCDLHHFSQCAIKETHSHSARLVTYEIQKNLCKLNGIKGCRYLMGKHKAVFINQLNLLSAFQKG